MKPGDRVQVRRDAEHVFDSFRDQPAEVEDTREIGGRTWLRLAFASGRTTWLPADRLELVEEEEADARA